MMGSGMRDVSAAAAAPATALTTVVGFTPAPSGDDDSDYGRASPPRSCQKTKKTKLQDIVSANSSPMQRSSSAQSVGGISKLKLQLETLTLDHASARCFKRSKSQLRSQPQSSTGTMSGYNSDDETTSEGTSYEIPLENDFASADADAVEKPLVGAVEGGLVQDALSPRKMTASDFQPLRCLGKGTYGTVILVKQNSTGRLYAQKQFRKASLTVHKKLVEQTKTERSILESVNRHPFVVKLFYAFQDHEKLYLLLEYAQGGELFTHLAQERMFTEEVASFYMAEMVLALEHLHRNLGVVYRDLKPENCLLDAEGHLLLTDFGLSKVAVDDDDDCKSMLGTVEYMAPEVILGQKYGMAVDWWSLGALGFDLLTGAPPFPGNNHAKIQEKIVKQKLVMPYFLGPDSKDLLTRLLRKEPAKRLGANMPKDLVALKKHRFFRRLDWEKLRRRECEAPIRPFITDPELAENFAGEFTDLALSPTVERKGLDMFAAELGVAAQGDACAGCGARDATSGGRLDDGMGDGDLFGGFSYVASRSLLEYDGFPCDVGR